MPFVIVKGRRIDQEKLRKFLDGINTDDCEIEPGIWRSPITGELFASKGSMVGSWGVYFRKPNNELINEPSRAGYMRARRAGLEPTQEQRDAHAAYMRELRARGLEGKKHADVILEAVKSMESLEPHEDRRRRLADEKAERVRLRRQQADEAYRASLSDDVD